MVWDWPLPTFWAHVTKYTVFFFESVPKAIRYRTSNMPPLYNFLTIRISGWFPNFRRVFPDLGTLQCCMWPQLFPSHHNQQLNHTPVLEGGQKTPSYVIFLTSLSIDGCYRSSCNNCENSQQSGNVDHLSHLLTLIKDASFHSDQSWCLISWL